MPFCSKSVNFLGTILIKVQNFLYFHIRQIDYFVEKFFFNETFHTPVPNTKDI